MKQRDWSKRRSPTNTKGVTWREWIAQELCWHFSRLARWTFRILSFRSSKRPEMNTSSVKPCGLTPNYSAPSMKVKPSLVTWFCLPMDRSTSTISVSSLDAAGCVMPAEELGSWSRNYPSSPGSMEQNTCVT